MAENGMDGILKSVSEKTLSGLVSCIFRDDKNKIVDLVRFQF